jgi:hypothetical protein
VKSFGHRCFFVVSVQKLSQSLGLNSAKRSFEKHWTLPAIRPFASRMSGPPGTGVFAFSWRRAGAGFATEIKKILNAVSAIVAGIRREPGFPGYLH